MRFHFLGRSLLTLLVLMTTGFAEAAVQDELGVLKAVRRTFTLNLNQLLKQCHEESSSIANKVFECQVKEYSLNGTENVIQGTAGRPGKVFFYDDDEVSTVLEITPEGYQARVYLPEAGGDGQSLLRAAFAKHKLEGKQISILIHMVL